MVVDLPVENDGVAAVRSGHRLGAAVGRVDDGKPTVNEEETPVVQGRAAVPIGTAMGESGVNPSSERRAIGDWSLRPDGSNTAHQSARCGAGAR
jgi:hypothetical protein